MPMTAIPAILLSTILLLAAAPLEAAESPLGRQVQDFSLRDYRGKLHGLADYADRPLVVIAVLGTECPLARLYGPRLGELAKGYADRGVVFLGLNANRQDSVSEVAAYARQHGIPFPILKDPGNVVADRLGAVRTPEVFVLDGQRVIRYWGRIDDQYVVGQQRTAPSRRDLAVALDELLDGRPVSQPVTEAVGCFIGRVRSVEPTGSVTYSNQISRILAERCVSCHRPGEVAPFPLTSYDEVVGWGETIREVVALGRMPPWFANPAHGRFANDVRMSPEEKQLLADWVANGCPEGDPAELPPARRFTDGWQISEPDLVLAMADKPFTVPAEGEVRYQYFTVDPGFAEDKWIQAAEARPGNRGVVHHILCRFVPPEQQGRRGGEGPVVGYAPGLPPAEFPPGAALLVPAGSKLVFQMHYTPNGSVQTDRSFLGLVFADPATVRQPVHGGAIANRALTIPPGADNHEVTAEANAPRDLWLLSLTPHMHLRGKAFRYEAHYPDGGREVLLDIPSYDFNWQLTYKLAEPKRIAKGTRVVCTAWYDNSSDNLANPDPTSTVRWGDQTWEEMMIGYYSCLYSDPDRLAGGQPSGAALDPAAPRSR